VASKEIKYLEMAASSRSNHVSVSSVKDLTQTPQNGPSRVLSLEKPLRSMFQACCGGTYSAPVGMKSLV